LLDFVKSAIAALASLHRSAGQQAAIDGEDTALCDEYVAARP
jgi:hypothetical protein